MRGITRWKKISGIVSVYTGSWGQSNERLSPGSLVCTESPRRLEGISI